VKKILVPALLGVCLSLPVFAQQAQTQTGKLGEVVLFGEENVKIQSATKTEIPLSKAPASVTVITAKQIKESEARTLVDLLRLVAGVNVRWNPMVPTIDVRGFGENPFSNRLLILVDGQPINSLETSGFPMLYIFDVFPLEMIKRVEIVRGPGSALYGENAFWGVISIVTWSGEDLGGGNASFLAGSRRTLWGSLSYGQKFGDLSLFGAGREYRSQPTPQVWRDSGSDIKASDVYLKGSYKGVTASYYQHHDHQDGFREEFPPEQGFPPGSVFKSADVLGQTLRIATLRYESPKDEPYTVNADFGYSGRYGMHCAGCHAPVEKPDYSTPENHGYQVTADLRLGIHSIPSHDILVGFDGRKLDVGDHKEELSPDQPGSYKTGAVYVQDQWSLFDGKASIVGGLRYDAKSKLFDDYWSPRIAVVVNPSKRVVLRAGYGTAFRFPGFSELYSNPWFLTIQNEQLPIPAFPLVVFKPNPGLVPEEVRTFDLGAEVQLTPQLSAKLDLYHERVKHFIVIDIGLLPPPTPSTIGFVNHPAEGNVEGGELELRANVTNVVTGFVSYAFQEESQVGDAVDPVGNRLEFVYAPKHKINVGAYAGPFAGVRGTLELEYRDRYVAPSFWYLVTGDPTVRPLPSYTFLNARISYELPFELRGKKPVRLSLYGHNLLDKTPAETLVGSPANVPGREFFGRVEVSF
jgi:iron complex outermembrane receptor protein